MPRKKTIPPDDQPAEAQGTAESAGEENTGQLDLPAPVPEGGDTVDSKEPAVTAAGDAESLWQPPDDEDAESDSPEYGTLLRELGQADHDHADAEEPLALDPLPDAAQDDDALTPASSGPEDSPEANQTERPGSRTRRVRDGGAADTASPARRERILTIDARDEVQTAEDQEAVIWHEIQNAHWTRRILTGKLDGVERTPTGITVAVVNYKGFRVMIPVKEMLIFTGRVPSGADYEEMMFRMRGILSARLGSEVDFMVKGHENKTRSVVGSRKDAMYRKRQTFYLDKNEHGEPMIYEGRIVQARVVAVAEKIVRVEVFGVECPIVARGLSRSWVGDAKDDYYVGKRILVRVNKIVGTTVEDLTISADVRSVSETSAIDDLKKCAPQGRYAGRVTDVRGGVLFIRLNNGVNAIAHSCYDRRAPGKGDDVSFSVTRLDEDQGVAIGIITRIIKQNL